MFGICQEYRELALTMYCCMFSKCGKCYNTKFNLKRHIEITHLKIKKYQCQECDKLFVSNQNLSEHMHTHSGARPFLCKICPKNFRQASQLSLHRRAHIIPTKSQSLIDSETETISKEKQLNALNYNLRTNLDLNFFNVLGNSDILLLPKLREITKFEPFMPNLPSIF